MSRFPLGVVIAVALGLSVGAAAQSSNAQSNSGSGSGGLQNSELSIQVSGVFNRTTTASNLTTNPSSDLATNSAGLLVGYRLHLNHWEALEVEYGYTHNGQDYYIPSTTPGTTAASYGVSAAMHQFMLNEVFTTPRLFDFLQPFVLGGGGLVHFSPNSSSVVAATGQTLGAFNVGAGFDFHIDHIGARVEYQAPIFKVPDFHNPALIINKWTYVNQPSVGLIFTF